MLRAEATAWQASWSVAAPSARIEAWVAGNIDGLDDAMPGEGVDEWDQRAIDILAPGRSAPGPRRERQGPAVVGGRVAVSRKAGASVVRLRDRSLVKEADIEELGEELADLIAAGHRRLVLDFRAVERVSCRILPILAEVARLCEQDPGGRLKVVNLLPELVPVVGLCRLTRSLAVPSDESTALGGPWPVDGPRPLPQALLFGLNALKRGAEEPLMQPSSGSGARDVAARFPPLGDRIPYLVVADGYAAGRKILIGPEGLLIGRGEECRVRSDHALLSRRHAQVHCQGGRARVRDLGSTNGTRLNGEPLGRDEVEVAAGDRLEVGPFTFLVAIDDPRPEAIDDARIADWIGGEPDEGSPFEVSSLETDRDHSSALRPLRIEAIGDVVVVTPLDPNLLQTMEPDVMREELTALIERGASRRVVLNLEHSGRVSSAALGVFVAFHLRLDRLGGALRLCQPHARMAQFLDQIRLPLLMDIFPSKEDAVLSSWETPRELADRV